MNNSAYEIFRRQIFDFLWQEVEPLAAGIDQTGFFPQDELFPKFRDYGLWGLLIPERYGGKGLTTKQYLPFLAEFSKVAGVVRVLLHVHNTSARAVVRYGTEAQKEWLLPALAQGKSSLTFAITEPNSGSGMDVACQAVRDGNEWIVTGTKHYITNAGFADLHLVCCRTREKPGEHRDRRALTALVIPTDTPGFTIEPMPRMMGNNGPHHGILGFDGARVPLTNIIGAEGDGLEVFLGELEPSRAFVAASSLGAAERALEIALDFSKHRKTFGKTIAERPSIQSELAEMVRDVYALRLILEDVAEKIDKAKDCALEASIAKLTGLETVTRVTDKALDVIGGRAYFTDYPYPLERIYREARINLAEEGTPSIQRLVMARALLEQPTPLAIGTLGDPYQPAGTNPALGKNSPADLTYAHDHKTKK